MIQEHQKMNLERSNIFKMKFFKFKILTQRAIIDKPQLSTIL